MRTAWRRRSRGGSGVGLPDAAFLGAGRDVEDPGLLQRARVVRHDPAIVRTNIAGGGPGDENVAAGEEQGGALIFEQRIELIGERQRDIQRGIARRDHGGNACEIVPPFVRSE